MYLLCWTDPPDDHGDMVMARGQPVMIHGLTWGRVEGGDMIATVWSMLLTWIDKYVTSTRQ